mgnify:CR=1 FL=1
MERPLTNSTHEPIDSVTSPRWTLGVDLGHRSVGLAAVALDPDGTPSEILASNVVRLDGGLLPGSEKSPVSRKAAAGMARRVRRLHRRRRARLKALDRHLMDLGFPVDDGPETYESWLDRAHLVEGRIADETERRRATSRAVRHIARHRGWRNPWLSWSAFAELSTPSDNHKRNLAAAAERFDRETEGWTVGQLGAAGTDPRITIRPRTAKDSRRVAQGEAALLEHRVLQEDQLAELRQIWTTQEWDLAELPELEKAVFTQAKPSVPPGNVGRDALPGMQTHQRAPRASLEFQRFRIQSVVGDLRVPVTERSRDLRPLTPEERERVTGLLERWHEREGHVPGERPTWRDVAEAVGVSLRNLRGRDTSDYATATPPTMETLDRLKAGIAALKPAAVRRDVAAWFDEADENQISAFVSYLADSTDTADEALEEAGLTDVITGWDDTALEKLGDLSLEPGRAAYSVQSLRRLADRMQSDAIDLQEARKREFGVDDSWTPPTPSIETPTGMPAVDQNLVAVRRFVMSMVSQFGMPQLVVIEHVRESFLGVTAVEELRRQQRLDRRRREAAEHEVAIASGSQPKAADVRRYSLIQRQNGQCAYCGAAIGLRNSELDHIVPRAVGGASTRANLLAVCRACNNLKGKQPFAVWADGDTRTDEAGEKLVSVEGALARTRSWMTPRPSIRERNELREIRQRLRQRESDEPIDERSMESTAYAATALVERLRNFFETQTADGGQIPPVRVYRGSITASARKSSGVDAIVRLRGKSMKHRGDFRHHAIDAAVCALMTPSVARTLAIRESLRTAHRFTGDEHDWKSFTGDSPQARAEHTAWTARMQTLAKLLRDAVDADQVPVSIPLRLGRRVGRVHEDIIRPFETRELGGTWSPKELERIVDRRLYTVLHDRASSATSGMEVTEELCAELGSTVETTVDLYGSPAAQIPVRGGSARLGSIHHARLYAWHGTRGIEFGMVRVFAGELAAMWPSPATDVLTAPVPTWSMSYRRAAPPVMKRLRADTAVPIGWIAPGDEIVVLPRQEGARASSLDDLVASVGEDRWTITGFEQPGIINIVPRLLSAEGISEETPEAVASVLTRSGRPSTNSLVPRIRVIRRDALGRERQRGGGRLPSSFVPFEVAEQRLQGD